MNATEFEDRLRENRWREPFRPFAVTLRDGRKIEIEHPGVAFGGGAAWYCTPNYEFVDFTCDEVVEIESPTLTARS